MHTVVYRVILWDLKELQSPTHQYIYMYTDWYNLGFSKSVRLVLSNNDLMIYVADG